MFLRLFCFGVFLVWLEECFGTKSTKKLKKIEIHSEDFVEMKRVRSQDDSGSKIDLEHRVKRKCDDVKSSGEMSTTGDDRMTRTQIDFLRRTFFFVLSLTHSLTKSK